jgi:hypothetical protein
MMLVGSLKTGSLKIPHHPKRIFYYRKYVSPKYSKAGISLPDTDWTE